jgi:hypothetical protein
MAFIAAGLYLAVPGVRGEVETGIKQGVEAAAHGINSVFASKYKNGPRTAGEIIAADKQDRNNKLFQKR